MDNDHGLATLLINSIFYSLYDYSIFRIPAQN